MAALELNSSLLKPLCSLKTKFLFINQFNNILKKKKVAYSAFLSSFAGHNLVVPSFKLYFLNLKYKKSQIKTLNFFWSKTHFDKINFQDRSKTSFSFSFFGGGSSQVFLKQIKKMLAHVRRLGLNTDFMSLIQMPNYFTHLTTQKSPHVNGRSKVRYKNWRVKLVATFRHKHAASPSIPLFYEIFFKSFSLKNLLFTIRMEAQYNKKFTIIS